MKKIRIIFPESLPQSEILDLKRCNVKGASVVKKFASGSISLDIHAS